MEEEFLYNLKAKVRLYKDNGFLFATIVDDVEYKGEKIGDVYVHVSHITPKGFKWSTVRTGMNIMLNQIMKTNRGWSAVEASFIKPKK